jgi:hypothetical protein
MSAPTLEVVFAFDADAGGETNFFTLDDPVAGVLDNTEFTLGGEFSLVDVTEYVRNVTVSRGRSRLVDKVQSGSSTIVLDNRQRLFDPTAGTAVSPYADSIVPRKNVSVRVNDEPVFTGLVDDWNLSFPANNDYTTEAQCADGFLSLAQVTVGTATQSAELSGTRVESVLTDAAWPLSKRNIDAGEVSLQADTPSANTNLVDYLSRVSDTELGAFFMSRDGDATFKDRLAVQQFTNPLVIGGTGIPFESVEVDYGSEQLYNRVELTRDNGGTAIATDATSQTTYGINEFSRSNLLFDDDTELKDLADYLLTLYKDPVFRIEQVTIVLEALTTAQQRSVAALDITDPVEVTFTPTVGPSITQFATVDKIEFSLSPSRSAVKLSVSQAQAAFILDSSTFGVLDTDTLGF